MGIAKGHIWLALHKQFPSSPGTLRRIGDVCGNRVDQLQSFSEEDLVRMFGKSAAKKLCVLSSTIRDVKEEWSELRARGINVIPFTDRRYPNRLKQIGTFPPILYMLGNASLLKHPAVGICGSRNASDDGLRHSMRFGAAAAHFNLTVVSGYAKGVDTAAHLGAINSKGNTIIVLPEGISHFKKKREFRDVDDFSDRSLVISQFYPKQTWQVPAAMERNAVICGLSNALAVIEAGSTGGTIASGRVCLSQGKPLWVIDYGCPPASAEGNQILISEGGRELRSVREWKYAMCNVLADSHRGGKNKRLNNMNGQSGSTLEEAMLKSSADDMEKQLELSNHL